jgi:hypothetical protein
VGAVLARLWTHPSWTKSGRKSPHLPKAFQGGICLKTSQPSRQRLNRTTHVARLPPLQWH